MELTNEELKNLARRCRLILNEDELEKYRGDLAALERLAAALLPYDGDRVDFALPCELSQMRPDVAMPFEATEMLFPDRSSCEGAYLSVPCTIEGG